MPRRHSFVSGDPEWNREREARIVAHQQRIWDELRHLGFVQPDAAVDAERIDDDVERDASNPAHH